jgi:acetyl-CoA C-acetyltransferase
MQEYMNVHGVTEEDFAHVSAQEYANAQLNPYAQMNGVEVTLAEAATIGKRNRYVIDGLPLKTYDCSQITDGYAGMILATEEGLVRLGVAKADCVRLAGYGQATDPLLRRGREVLRPAGANAAMRAAYEMAGLEPGHVNVAEIHDCFTVMGGIGAEVIGKAPYGQGLRYWKEGCARPDGDCGINTSGGLIAKGHPIGASGIAMVGWAAWQLLHKVPDGLQVPNARVAATFNIGGPICASVCTVLTAA